MAGLLEVSNIQCNYDNLVVIKDLSFTLADGDIGCLLGPSGCGKSTILRAIAGFENLHAGQISLAGKTLSSTRESVAPEHRSIGMVFQDYALFPHLNVADNIHFGLKKISKKIASDRVSKLIELVNLSGFEARYPHELSGGQQQRVALARALAPEPSLILLDEPFSNLDTELRNRLSIDIRDILKELGISAILVTHDQKEAFAMCDQVGVIDSGTIQQWGTPFELYHEPVNRFVARFVGRGSFIRGTTLTPDTFDSELGIIQGNRAYNWPAKCPVEILIRPDDIVFDSDSPLSGTISGKTFAGTFTQYQITLKSGTHIEASFPSHQDLYIGNSVNFALDAEHLIAYPL